MTARLWDKGETLHRRVHDFTIGSDPEIDLRLVPSDLVGSAAHAKMLQSIGFLTEAELESLLSGLKEALFEHLDGSFSIPRELEDCHTAIENYLTEKCGEAGLKIHTGRSRNDQVLLAMRLFLRTEIIRLLRSLNHNAKLFLSRIGDLGSIPMPGYTHFQPAMPASIGMWLGAFLEHLIELQRDGLQLIESINLNPLGVASGFGTPLPLNRELTTKLLGFSSPQRNPINTQNSRGRAEVKFVRWLTDISGMMEKFAWDTIIYSSSQFGFLTIPREFTTGSSIMPQKRNPDVLELMRGRAAKVRACEMELSLVVAKLPSHYHRDFQYTKEPVIAADDCVSELLSILAEVIPALDVNRTALEQAMTSDLYVTYDAFREVQKGMPFRDAYKLTANRFHAGEIKREDLEEDFKAIEESLARELKVARAELSQLDSKINAWAETCREIETRVFEIALR